MTSVRSLLLSLALLAGIFLCVGPSVVRAVDDEDIIDVVRELMSADCQLSEWSDWGPCSAPCGTGTQSRTRSIVKSPKGSGKACNAVLETRRCTLRECGEKGFFATVLYYCCVIALAAEGVFLVLLLAPLPGGMRTRVINGANYVWDHSERVRFGVTGAFAVVLLVFVANLYAVQSMDEALLATNADAQLVALQATTNMYLSGATALLMLVLYRIQQLLKHYIAKAKAAEEALKKTS